mmetsp:Transcript_30370/g.98741  ORF Transcript_30370/g.98741 Transcript_30370/m.98741 type:complete len:465 (+) Transcript_30370:4487-5881(+)
MVTEILSRDDLLQPRRAPKKRRHRFCVERIWEQLDPLQKGDALGRLFVVVSSTHEHAPLQVLAPLEGERSLTRVQNLHGHGAHAGPDVLILLRVSQLRLLLGGATAEHLTALSDRLHDDEQALETEQVHGTERTVDREGVFAQERCEILKEVGTVELAVVVCVELGNKRALAAQVDEAFECDALLLETCVAAFGKRHEGATQKGLDLYLERAAEVHVQHRHNAAKVRQDRRVWHMRNLQHSFGERFLHECKDRRVVLYRGARRLKRCYDERETERTQPVHVLFILQRHQRDEEAENLDGARKPVRRADCGAALVVGGVVARRLPLLAACRAAPVRPSLRCGFLRHLHRTARSLVPPRRGFTRRRRRRRLRPLWLPLNSPAPARVAIIALLGRRRGRCRRRSRPLRQRSKPAKDSAHHLLQRMPRRALEQRALLRGLMPDAIASLHNGAHVVVGEQVTRRALQRP